MHVLHSTVVNMMCHHKTNYISNDIMTSQSYDWHKDNNVASGQQCCVLGGLHNHLTYSTTADKDLKLQTTSPPAADGYGHVTQSRTVSPAA